MITELEQALVQLDGVKKAAGGYQARCPCHDDKHQSLSIAEKDGKIMLFCHAGCSFESIIKVLNLHTDRTNDTPIITATYDYTDAEGNLLYQVVRFQPKSFRQRRPVKDGWEWNLNGIKPTLYHLPEVLQAIKDKKLIWIAEGEKDVENLRKQGQVATTISGGVSTKWPPNLVPLFLSAMCCIIPDADEPGRKYAHYVANLLYGWCASLKIIPLPLKDVSEYFDSGGTLANLLNIYHNSSEYIPAGVVTREEFNELRGLNIYLLRLLKGKPRRKYETYG